MTSEERREARFQRRRAKRAAARAARYGSADSFDKTFSYESLYNSYRKCRRNVSWKASVQKYIVQAPLNVYKTYDRLQRGVYRSPEFFEFDIYERGKKRHIKSTVIGERIVQRALCDNTLVPVFFGSMIYDCGACMEGKGYTFAIKRMDAHLQKYIRKHGIDGYILRGDLKSFFDSIVHTVVYKMLRDKLSDERIIAITEDLIRMFDPNKPLEQRRGLGLGSQISQVLAPAVANSVDHYIKEVLRAKYYGRYMDDFYIISDSKEELHRFKELIAGECEKVGLVLHPNKTQIIKLRHGFTWLKVRYNITETGKIIHRIHPSSVTRERRKLKKLAVKYHSGKMSFKQVYNSWQSWDSHARRFQSYKTRQSIELLFARLFVGGGAANAILQSH